MNPKTAAQWARIALLLSFVSLLGAWYTQLSGSDLLGLSQTHLFSDATVLALLGIAGLMDAQVHAQKL